MPQPVFCFEAPNMFCGPRNFSRLSISRSMSPQMCVLLRGSRAAVSCRWEACLLGAGWPWTLENRLQPPSAHTLQGAGAASSASSSSSASFLRETTQTQGEFGSWKLSQHHPLLICLPSLISPLVCLNGYGLTGAHTSSPVLTFTW